MDPKRLVWLARSALAPGWLALCLAACARPQMPDPRDAARKYEEAVKKGDAAAVHALLSRDARASYSEEDVRALLERDQAELEKRAAACADPVAEVHTTATLRGTSPAEIELTLEDGTFRVAADSALFPRPSTPEAALRALAWALQSGQVQRVEATLSDERRAGLEERRAALLESLEGLEGASIEVLDHRAVVELPDGQVVELVEEQGVWRVEAVP